MLKRLTVLVLAGCLCASGCREGDEPAPQFNKSMEASGQTLVPTHVPDYSYGDKSILAAAARPEDVPAVVKPVESPADESAEIEIDDSSPEAILEVLKQISESQDLTLMPDIVVPEQQELFREFAEVLAPVSQAFQKFKAAWIEQFPDQPVQAGQQPGGMPVALDGSLTISDVVMISDAEAEATVQGTKATAPTTLKLKKIEDAWRIEFPDMPTPEQMEQARTQWAIIPAIADAIQKLAERIANDEFDSAEAASQAMMQVMSEAAAGAGAGPAQ